MRMNVDKPWRENETISVNFLPGGPRDAPHRRDGVPRDAYGTAIGWRASTITNSRVLDQHIIGHGFPLFLSFFRHLLVHLSFTLALSFFWHLFCPVLLCQIISSDYSLSPWR